MGRLRGRVVCFVRARVLRDGNNVRVRMPTGNAPLETASRARAGGGDVKIGVAEVLPNVIFKQFPGEVG